MNQNDFLAYWMHLAWLCIFLLLLSCVDNREFNAPRESCVDHLIANTTFSQVKNMHTDGVIEIQDDLIIEGYVISSDEFGNYFGTLHIQDSPGNPTQGFQINIDLRDSYLFYPMGSKIFIKLKGLYLGKQKGVYALGGVFPFFGNLSIGRLPVTEVYRHVFSSCEQLVPIHPTILELNSIDDNPINILVQLNNVEFEKDELGLLYAEVKEETIRTLVNCNDAKIEVVNSGYSDFQPEILPNGNGTAIGVLQKENNTYQLVIRNLDDIQLTNERCQVQVQVTSNKIFISEIADPDNNSKARFVELYNSDTIPLNLHGWTLNRYTNNNTEISATLDLTSYSIASNSTLVISANSMEFELVYGFLPDLDAGSNSPADSNGDDNLQLVDPFGTVIDTFGVIGEDGTGTNHEFEDGRALRKPEIDNSNPIFDPLEWVIYNDNGGSQTVNLSQNAPQDFTPGERE